MDQLPFTEKPPTEAGYWWVLYTQLPGVPIPKPQLTMVIKYPDLCQMMLIGDTKAYGIPEAPQEGILWAGPISKPSVPLAPGN